MPRTEDGIVRLGSLLQIAPPPRDDLWTQIVGSQREEENRGLQRIRRRGGCPDQIVGRPLPRRFGEEFVLTVEKLPQLDPLGGDLLFGSRQRPDLWSGRSIKGSSSGASLLAKTP